MRSFAIFLSCVSGLTLKIMSAALPSFSGIWVLSRLSESSALVSLVPLLSALTSEGGGVSTSRSGVSSTSTSGVSASALAAFGFADGFADFKLGTNCFSGMPSRDDAHWRTCCLPFADRAPALVTSISPASISLPISSSVIGLRVVPFSLFSFSIVAA